jgi:HD-like signal output (HDOD) protein
MKTVAVKAKPKPKPDSYDKFRELMEDPSSSIEDFSFMVSRDPTLASNVLNIVNSDFFGISGHIDNISRAITLLGIGQLYEIVSGMNSPELSGNLVHLPVAFPVSPVIRRN